MLLIEKCHSISQELQETVALDAPIPPSCRYKITCTGSGFGCEICLTGEQYTNIDRGKLPTYHLFLLEVLSHSFFPFVNVEGMSPG